MPDLYEILLKASIKMKIVMVTSRDETASFILVSIAKTSAESSAML